MDNNTPSSSQARASEAAIQASRTTAQSSQQVDTFRTAALRTPEHRTPSRCFRERPCRMVAAAPIRLGQFAARLIAEDEAVEAAEAVAAGVASDARAAAPCSLGGASCTSASGGSHWRQEVEVGSRSSEVEDMLNRNAVDCTPAAGMRVRAPLAQGCRKVECQREAAVADMCAVARSMVVAVRSCELGVDFGTAAALGATWEILCQ